MKWLAELCRAIDYIEDNLSGEISYSEAARIACCSTYYFQRVFSYIAGVPLSDYIRRRRMTAAAFELQSSDARMIDIGAKYGYESPSSFNRAFQSVHGVSPSSARAGGVTLSAYPRIGLSINVTGGEQMKYRVETKAAFRVVGVKTAVRGSLEQNLEIVPAFWDQVLSGEAFPRIRALAKGGSPSVLGVCCQDAADFYYYIAAATGEPVPEGMREYLVPANTWVIFESEGRFASSVEKIYKHFYMEWLPFSGYVWAESPDIEVYPIRGQKLDSGRFEVWIAIKKET